MSYSTRGSGGGFGGFPFRSSHQQGSDNNNYNNSNNNNSNNNNNNNRRRRTNSKKLANRKKRGGPITCHARFQIPPSYRKYLIGPGGLVISLLTDGSRCVINVPGKRQLENPLAMVTIQTSCLEFLFHGCWEILNIVNTAVCDEKVNDSDTSNMKYTLNIGGSHFQGNKVNCDGVFLVGTKNGIEGTEVSVYCIETDDEIDKGGISILVDNERFIDPDIRAQVIVISRTEIIASFVEKKQICRNKTPVLIFIYGTQQDKTRELYERIMQGLPNAQESMDTATSANTTTERTDVVFDNVLS